MGVGVMYNHQPRPTPYLMLETILLAFFGKQQGRSPVSGFGQLVTLPLQQCFFHVAARKNLHVCLRCTFSDEEYLHYRIPNKGCNFCKTDRFTLTPLKLLCSIHFYCLQFYGKKCYPKYTICIHFMNWKYHNRPFNMPIK